MKLLDALISPTQVQRYDLSWYLQQLMQSGGVNDPLGYRTTYSNDPAEPIGDNFIEYVHQAYRSSGVVYACQMVRLKVFSEARFQFQRMEKGRPTELFGDTSLSIFERPEPGLTTGDLLSRMILDADLAGNWFGTIIDGEIIRLRPDWVDIVLEPRVGPNGGVVGMRRLGYVYYEGGKDLSGSGLYTANGSRPEPFLVGEVAHFAPSPDPLANYRGMSWLTPVVREIQADTQATKHKLKFFENAATPNLHMSTPQMMTPDQFGEWVEMTETAHRGVDNAYRTLYTANGADATVIGANMQQMDFKATQGAGETRIANAAGVHPAVVGLSEGMAGSSLNAGNFSAAKRSTAQITIRPLWRNAAGSLEMLVPPPTGARLWYDDRDVEFLREDAKDAAEIRSNDANTLRTLADAGAKWDAAVDYVASGEVTRLRGQHSGLFSVQLQPPGTTEPTNAASNGAVEVTNG